MMRQDPWSALVVTDAVSKLQHFEDAAEEGEEASKPDRTYLVGRVALRTLFYDDHLLAAVKGGAIKQVVLLGAGMDSRAWRLDLPKGICAPPYLDLTKPVITVTKTGHFLPKDVALKI